MNRKTFLRQLGYVTAGTILTPPLLRLTKQNGPFFRMNSDIGYFTGRGGTIGWFVTHDAVVVVDSQFQNSAEDFISGITDYGTGPTRILFNTHHHGDHVSGNGVFSSENYQIIAHENVPILQRRVAEAQGNIDSMVAAEITFDDSYSIDLGTEQVTAKYYGSAHTGGDSVIWFENKNIAHMGDLVFNRWYPFIDLEGGASIQGWIELLETVAEEANRETRFIFGHGNVDFGVTGDTSDILYMRDFLSKLLDHTSEGLAAGKRIDEITNIEQFKEFPDHQSAGARLSLTANITAAYEELSSET
ncbi:MAG: MBL fold metallo-hydrolase [Balneolaceae bacterium]|nr:MAG: MBL fold metallo-hydrolase [Balneolaceae bacterium]